MNTIQQAMNEVMDEPNLIQRELRGAILEYQTARDCVKAANYLPAGIILRKEVKAGAMAFLNRSRGKLMNLIKATNVILGRVAA